MTGSASEKALNRNDFPTTQSIGPDMKSRHSNRRYLRRSIAAAITVSAVAVFGAGAASADPIPSAPGTPPAGKTPSQIYAGVGADADAELFNTVADEYNQTSPTALLASYDAVNSVTGAANENITTKPGCSVVRPNGANAGATAILTPSKSTVDTSADCIDFVRMSRAKKTDNSENSLTFYAFARDAVTWSTVGNSYAPKTLTTAQIKDIFECTITNWADVGGQYGDIHVYANPSSAATYTFFLQTIGSSIAAVQTGCGSSLRTVQQVDGSRLNGDPQGIYPNAVTKWAAQKNTPPGISDVRGGTVLGRVNDSTVSATIVQNVGGTDYTVLNPAFATGSGATQGRLLFNAVRNTASNDLKSIFAPGGFVCTNQNSLLIPFGATPLGTDTSATNYCGQTS